MKHYPDTFTSSLSLGLAIVLLLLLNGCASQGTTKDSASVVQDMPAQWSERSGQQATTASTVTTTWWQDFASPELDRLIAQGLQNNPDLGMATERIV